jgi:hypothetical protein
MKARIISNNKCLTLLRPIPNPPLESMPKIPKKSADQAKTARKVPREAMKFRHRGIGFEKRDAIRVSAEERQRQVA